MRTAFLNPGVSFRRGLIAAVRAGSVAAVGTGSGAWLRVRRAVWVGTSVAGLSLGGFAVVAVSLVSASVHAEGKAPVKVPVADPEFSHALKEGDRHYLDGKYAQAAAAYQKAVERQKHNPEGYARLAAAQRQQGQYDEAIATLGKGLETSSTVTERAKLIFLQADIQERRHALEKAQEGWSAYLELSGGAGERTIDLDAPEEEAPKPAVEGETVYPASASERQSQVEAAMKRYEDYTPVKERIRKREQEADVKSRSGR